MAPLTEQEKAARLEELREKLKSKKANQAMQDIEDNRKNEVSRHGIIWDPVNTDSEQKIRQKSTREAQDIREDLKRKKQMEELAKKKAEQAAEKAHKKAVLAKIEEDKARRRELAEKASGNASTSNPQPATVPATPSQPSEAPKATVSHNEARLRLQWKGGQTIKKLDAETTLFEVAQALTEEFQVNVNKFVLTYPRKVFQGEVDLSKTLREAGLVPAPRRGR